MFKRLASSQLPLTLQSIAVVPYMEPEKSKSDGDVASKVDKF